MGFQIQDGTGSSRKAEINGNNRLLTQTISETEFDNATSNENAFNIIALQPTGLFNINEDLDSKFIYCDIEIARKLFQFHKNQISSIEFKTTSTSSEEKTIRDLKAIFKDKVKIRTKAQLNDSLYKMLNSENLFIYLFSTLVVILTLFCLAGAIVMIIIDKKDNINTLFNIGLTFKEIRRIFFIYKK